MNRFTGKISKTWKGGGQMEREKTDNRAQDCAYRVDREEGSSIIFQEETAHVNKESTFRSSATHTRQSWEKPDGQNKTTVQKKNRL